MKIAYIGSCLSVQIVDAMLALDASHQRTGHMSHVRLDCLHEHWVQGVNLFPDRQTLGQITEDLTARNLLGKNANRLAMQSTEALEAFQETLRTADCLVIDNNYDLSARTWSLAFGSQRWRLSNLDVREGLGNARNLGLADLANVRTLYQELFEHFRNLNPSLQVVLVQYPTNGFARAGGTARVQRTETAAELLARLPGIVQLPLVDIDAANLSPKGAHYFSPLVYETYARAIMRMVGGEEAPGWLRDGVPFSRLLDWTAPEVPKPAAAGRNPYAALPQRQFWRPAVSDKFPLSIEALYDGKYAISRQDRIATFGSCFAQHIGHRLKARGFNYLDLEPAPHGLPARDRAAHGYGIYSARYGNVYTSLQMLQLFQQAFGERRMEEAWEHEGRYYDPLRPNITPGGFASPSDMLAERTKHLAAVRTLFATSDVIVFTLGLTECWLNRETGLAYPMAPGTTVASFDPQRHAFHNLGFAEVRRQVEELLAGLKTVNPSARVLLTVSPVPLTATYANRHVLVSTVHSKSLLRVVAGEIEAEHENVDYFPSYEIITSAPFKSMFYEPNLRNVREEGVDYVMSHFFRVHSPEFATEEQDADQDDANGEFCDEIFLEHASRHAPGAGG